MDTGKQITEASKRAAKSKQVNVKWCCTTNIMQDGFNEGLLSWIKYFKIVDGSKVKYHLKVTSDGIFSACSCPSFKFGMKYPLPEQQTVPFTSLYFAEHGHTFQCKHIIACINWTKGK